MQLTLSVLARVRTLFAAGASVEEVYEALVAPRAAAALRDSDALHARRVIGGSADVEVLAQEVARLATLVENLRQDRAGAVVPLRDAAPQAESMPEPVPQSRPEPKLERQPEPDPVTPPVPEAPVAAPPAVAPVAAQASEEPPPKRLEEKTESRPQKPQAANPATDDAGASALDLRDQIAVAVMRISMLMGDDDRRPSAAKPDAPRRAG